MRHIPALAIASLKMLVRDRAAMVGLVLGPIIFVLAFRLFDLSAVGFTPPGAAGSDYFDFVLPGLLAMGLMQLLLVGTAASVARYRELLILKRIQATPLRPTFFIAGQVTARLAVAAGLLAIMLAIGLALGATVRGSWLALLAVASLGNLVFLILAFAVAGRTRSVDAASNFAGLATIPLMFLSGMFFPLETLPAALRGAVEWLPITPLVAALRRIALEGATVAELGSELAVIAAWIPLSLLLARATFRFSEAG